MELDCKIEIETWMMETILWAICLPLCFLLEIESRKDDDYALYAYKYRPDAQVNIWSNESYESMMKEVKKFFIKLELEAEQKMVDALLEEFEKRERRREQSRRDEDHDRRDL